MNAINTKGIRVSVRPTFQKEQSDPSRAQYIFSYEVTIRNESTQRVQLISRHWIIYDSIGQHREVKGEGVIGQQPILRPKQEHRYRSWCPLMTDMGFMHGSFQMLNLDTGEEFEALIPKFELIPPYRMS